MGGRSNCGAISDPPVDSATAGVTLDSEALSRVPPTGRSQKWARPHGAVTVLVLAWGRGMQTAISAGEYLRPRTPRRWEAGSQICKDMKTYRGGGPNGVVRFHSDSTPLRTGKKSAVRGVRPLNAGAWRE